MISIVLFALTTCEGFGDIIDPTNEEIRNALMLPFAAGLSTVLGACAAFWISLDDLRKGQSKFLAGSLSYAAAVMIYVSFVALWPEAKAQFEYGGTEDELLVHLYTGLSFFKWNRYGVCIKICVNWCEDQRQIRKLSIQSKARLAVEMQSDMKKRDELTQEADNKSDDSSVIMGMTDEDTRKSKIMRTGIITALSIALHNFPEGLVAFLAAVADWQVGVVTAFAIAVHNLPEGISIAVPYYYASESRWKAFAITFLSGLAELFGALLGWAILDNIWGREVFAILFALTGGIMVYISIAELLPMARRNDPLDQVTTICFFLGMLTIEVSLVIEKY